MANCYTTLSTPELDAKLQQAEAVRSAASAIDQKVLSGARVQQIEAALNMWQQAQAGRELAQKTFDRVKALYEQGVVPAQKFDEAQAQYNAMTATASAAKAQYDLAVDGASKEEKAAAAAQVRQAAGVVSEVESYLSDAMVLFARYGRNLDDHRRAGRAGGQRLSRGRHPRHERHVGDVQHQGDADAKDPNGRKRLRGYVPALDRDVDFHITSHRSAGDFATWARDAHAGRIRHPYLRRQRAKPLGAEEGMRPGMSVLVDWDAIE